MGPLRAPCQLPSVFELTQPISRSLARLALCVVARTTEKQGQLCRARLGGPRTASRTTDTILDCAVVKHAFYFGVPEIGKLSNL